MAIIAVINCLINSFDLSVLYIVFAVVIGTAMVILMDGIFALIIRRCLPNRWFLSDKTIFSAKEKEALFYEKIKIKKWKDKIAELGFFTNFSKKRIKNPKSEEYVDRYILEANYGVIIHLICVFAGFLIIFIYPFKYVWCFCVPIATVNAVLNYLPFCVLRYNLKKLHVLKKFNERKKVLR